MIFSKEERKNRKKRKKKARLSGGLGRFVKFFAVFFDTINMHTINQKILQNP